jgi:hypothetical protein
LTAGTNLSLFCTVHGTTHLIQAFSFEWLHFNATGFSTKTGTNSSRLNFPSLKLSEAGEYMCQVNIRSHLLNSDLTIMSHPQLIQVFSKLWYTCQLFLMTFLIVVPIPLITVIPPSQAIFVGSSPNVTCVAEFNDTVDVPLVVTIILATSALLIDSDYSVHMESYARYTRIFTIKNIRESQTYFCGVYPYYSELSLHILMHQLDQVYAYREISISK